MRSIFALFMMVLAWGISTTSLSAQQPDKMPATQWLAEFSKNWDEAKWEKMFRTSPVPYMRPLPDDDWKARMRAFQGVVAGGKDSIPALLEALKDKDVARRVFAAQALGYLAPDVPLEPLLEAAKNDPNAAVRLYAIDAIGMKGVKDFDFDALLKTERGGDVRKHINYAKERKGAKVEAADVKLLTEWDASTIDSAVIGKQAPDFTLKSATGETIKLSNFKGKSAVVLVFVYGDT